MLIKSLKSLISLNSEFLKKFLLINLIERSPVLILLLNAAVLYKLFSAFYNVINIKKLKLKYITLQ